MRKQTRIMAGPILKIIPAKGKIETNIVGLKSIGPYTLFGNGEPGLTALFKGYQIPPSIVIGDLSLEGGRYISITPTEETGDSITLNIRPFDYPAKAVKLLFQGEEVGTMPVEGGKEDFKKARE